MEFSIDTMSVVRPVDISMMELREMIDASTQTYTSWGPNIHVEFHVIDVPNLTSPGVTPIKMKNMMESPEWNETPEFKTPSVPSEKKRNLKFEV